MSRNSPHHEITWLIRRLFRALGHTADEYLGEYGITAADRAVLEFLYPDRRLSVPEIASRYQVSRQHVQVTVNGLIDKRLLETRSNPRHKRSPLIVLTKAGRQLFADIRDKEAEVVEALFDGIPARDIECTKQTLEAMYFQNLMQGDIDETRQ